MVKVRIDEDEWYPFYAIVQDGGETVTDLVIDIDNRLLARWKLAQQEIDDVMKEVQNIIKLQGRKNA